MDDRLGMRRARKAAGLTLEELEKRLGEVGIAYSHSVVNQRELGRQPTSLPDLVDWARACNTTLVEMLPDSSPLWYFSIRRRAIEIHRLLRLYAELTDELQHLPTPSLPDDRKTWSRAVAEEIKGWRVARQMSLDHLAERCHGLGWKTSRGRLHRMERAESKVNLDQLEVLARAFAHDSIMHMAAAPLPNVEAGRRPLFTLLLQEEYTYLARSIEKCGQRIQGLQAEVREVMGEHMYSSFTAHQLRVLTAPLGFCPEGTPSMFLPRSNH